jgi:hypothetical protein
MRLSAFYYFHLIFTAPLPILKVPSLLATALLLDFVLLNAAFH